MVCQRYSSSNFRAQIVIFAHRLVVGNLRECGYYALAHSLVFGQLPYGIGVALERLADKHVFQQLAALCADAVAVEHFRHLRLRYHACALQLQYGIACRRGVRIELCQSVISVYALDYAVEHVVRDDLAHLHALFRLALAFHLLLVELGERLGRVWHGLVCHEDNARMPHAMHLFFGKAVFLRVLRKVADVCPIRVVTCGEFACHCPAVAAQHHSVRAYHDRVLQCAAIIVSRYVTCHFLCILVALIVAVVHALPVLVDREALALGELARCIMGRSCRAAFDKHVTPLYLFPVG